MIYLFLFVWMKEEGNKSYETSEMKTLDPCSDESALQRKALREVGGISGSSDATELMLNDTELMHDKSL